MIAKGIVIHWHRATEFVQLDPSNIDATTQITKTIEYWKSTKGFVAYATTSQVNETSDGYIVRVNYHHELNQSINKEDACWGHSIIHISNEATSGKAEWHDDNFPEKYNGDKRWEFINTGLNKEPLRETLTRTKRNQSMLRKALIATGAACAITGEQTIEALEAAHIIPSSKKGAEVIDNAILLRADLHKLYDNGLFSIAPDGRVIDIAEGISNSYKQLLSGIRVSQDAIDRVRLAIEAVGQIDNPEPHYG